MFEVNKQVANPALLAAIDAAKVDFIVGTEADLWHELEHALFLSPVTLTPQPESDKDGNITLEKGTIVGYLSLLSVDSEYLPAFTDCDELRKWSDDPDEEALISTFDELCDLIRKNPKFGGITINPYGCNLIITPEMIQWFKEPEPTWWALDGSAKVRIGTPTNYPRELAAAVAKYLKTQKNVKRAYLALMDKDGESSYLMALDFAGNRRATFDGIAAVAEPHLEKGELLEMVPLGSGVGAKVARDYAPFYKRKAFGLF